MMGWLVMALFDPNRTFQRSVVHIAIKLAAVATQKTLDKNRHQRLPRWSSVCSDCCGYLSHYYLLI